VRRFRPPSARFTRALAAWPATNVAAAADASARTAAGGRRFIAVALRRACSAPGFNPLGFATVFDRLPFTRR
jgi:hypothetical protein